MTEVVATCLNDIIGPLCAAGFEVETRETVANDSGVVAILELKLPREARDAAGVKSVVAGALAALGRTGVTGRSVLGENGTHFDLAQVAAMA